MSTKQQEQLIAQFMQALSGMTTTNSDSAPKAIKRPKRVTRASVPDVTHQHVSEVRNERDALLNIKRRTPAQNARLEKVIEALSSVRKAYRANLASKSA